MIDFVYIINSNFYTKHIKNKNGKYLPFFDTDIKEELIKKNILIYTKSFGFNGIINILKIIDISDPNYKILIADYCLGSSNNLYFFEIDNIHLFNRSYKYRDYINYCKTNKSKYINFSMYDDLIITKNFSNFFNDFMQKINITDTETKLEQETKPETKTEPKTKLEKEIIKVSFRIPILWIPCLELLDIIERKKISKKIFRNHYSNCSSCQFTNNNHNLHLTFDTNYKVNLINHFSIINYYNYYNDPKNNLDNSNTTSSDSDSSSNSDTCSDSSSDSSTDTEYSNDLYEYKYDSDNDILYDNEESITIDKLIEKIVRCYATSTNYEEEVENIKLIGLENGMYNILYYSNINEDHIYNNSLFIIK